MQGMDELDTGEVEEANRERVGEDFHLARTAFRDGPVHHSDQGDKWDGEGDEQYAVGGGAVSPYHLTVEGDMDLNLGRGTGGGGCRRQQLPRSLRTMPSK